MSVIFIVGQTSTGKTSLAYELSVILSSTFTQLQGVDMLSADSKQVYTGMDVVTGKDIPPDFQRHEAGGVLFYESGTTRLYGVDMVKPNEEWSVAHFVRYARERIKRSDREQRLLFIVGGTGMYIESLVKEPMSLFVSPNVRLRKKLSSYPIEKLQIELALHNRDRLEKMNNSDRNNPRRLIRAIEVAQSNIDVGHGEGQDIRLLERSLWIGLTSGGEVLKEKIKQRVAKRIQEGAIEETKRLQDTYPDWTIEARAAIGYADIEDYLKGNRTLEQLEEQWSLHEYQYAKKQEVWFKKRTGITWSSTQKLTYKENIVETIKNWYTQNN